MYSVSESYKNALLKNVINDTVSGTVTLTDGTVIELNDNTIVSGSLKISHELCGEYAIGTFNLGSLKIGFFDDSALLRDFSCAEIKITYKIETEEGWEEIPMGIFIVDGSSVKRKRSIITLTAYDYGILFDCTLSDELRKMTATAENLIKSACGMCGVTFGEIAVGLPNTEVVLNPASSQIQSCRDLVEWCAVLLCGYAVIDREGKLKIISAKYGVSEDDASDIIIDKYLGSFERDSFYSTDTRAWIASLSAYSGNNRKIYKSTITQSDEQAARAIYTLEKNPLLADKSEVECDEINNAWLNFIDGFKQRGITAAIYGDPALDVGDVMRCSEGDIDQRVSIVGLVTRSEWRYRNFHNIVCASAQLSDGFPEEESSEADNPKALKVISQLEKRLDRMETGGVGVFVSGAKSAERFNDYVNVDLEAGDYSHAEGQSTTATGAASHAEGWGSLAGGVMAHAEGATTWALGNYSHTEGMNTKALGEASHAGGEGTIALGDAQTVIGTHNLEDENALFIIGCGRKEDAKANALLVDRFGNLSILGNLHVGGTIETDGSSEFEDYTAGDGIHISKKEISVLLGEGLELGEDGSINVTAGGTDSSYSSGQGIQIIEEEKSKKISVKIGEGLEIDGDGAVSSMINADNSIIIQEADASCLLHSYTQVEYIKGNKIGYAGPGSKIVCQGYVFDSVNPDNYSLSSDIHYGGSVDIRFAASASDFASSGRFYVDSVFVSGSPTTDCYLICPALNFRSEVGYYYGNVGIFFKWISINPPNEKFPYGYVVGHAMMTGKAHPDAINYYHATNLACQAVFPFASEAEYNAAVGLTYTPNTLTEVQETVTEV